MKCIIGLFVLFLISCETDNRTISVYKLTYCDNRPPEQVYCSSISGIPPSIETWKQAVSVFSCRDLNGMHFNKLNVCDTTLISKSVTE